MALSGRMFCTSLGYKDVGKTMLSVTGKGILKTVSLEYYSNITITIDGVGQTFSQLDLRILAPTVYYSNNSGDVSLILNPSIGGVVGTSTNNAMSEGASINLNLPFSKSLTITATGGGNDSVVCGTYVLDI